MPSKPGSLRHYAERYGVSYEAIRKLKAEGVDLEDETTVETRLGLGGSSSLPLTLPESIDGLGIKAAVERLRSAERAAYQDYSAAKGEKEKSLAARKKSYLALFEQLRKVAGDEKAIAGRRGQSTILLGMHLTQPAPICGVDKCLMAKIIPARWLRWRANFLMRKVVRTIFSR